MGNLAVLILRVVVGGLLTGHGAQKLFGTFGEHGLEGTSGFMEMLGLRPGRPWAFLAGLSEFGGGLLSALGLLNPLGPIGIIASMTMATAKAHWGKPIWVTEGGAELPVTNTAISTALLLSGPGKYSLDKLLGVRLPRRLVLVPGLVLAAVTVAVGVVISSQPAPQTEAQSQTEEQKPQAVRVAERPAQRGSEGEKVQEAPKEET